MQILMNAQLVPTIAISMQSVKIELALSSAIVSPATPAVEHIAPIISEGEENPPPCHVNANCINQNGSRECQCKSGFTGNGVSCSGTYLFLIISRFFHNFFPVSRCRRVARDWQDARGIWHNAAKNFLVWINEEDHVRVVAMQNGGDMRAVFARFCDGL